MGVQERVRRFIIENFYVPDPASLGDEASLLELAIVDSTGVLEIVAFLESEFGVTVEDADLTPENLETIGRIARFVARKQSAPAPAQ